MGLPHLPCTASFGEHDMPLTVRRSRTISLRLSEREFETLRNLYAAKGARSISEFIRSALNRILSETAHEDDALELKVQEIDGKLTILDGEVARLTQLFGALHEPR